MFAANVSNIRQAAADQFNYIPLQVPRVAIRKTALHIRAQEIVAKNFLQRL
jgi:hypothetical protein